MRSTFITLFKIAANLPLLLALLTPRILLYLIVEESHRPLHSIQYRHSLYYWFTVDSSYFLSPQLEYKLHKSRDFILFFVCFTPWTHSSINYISIHIGPTPPVSWTNSDLWTESYQLVQPRIRFLSVFLVYTKPGMSLENHVQSSSVLF